MRIRMRAAGVATVAAVALVTGGLVGTSIDFASAGTSSVTARQAPRTEAVRTQVAVQRTMTTLWMQHMEWTYATVVAFASDSPGLDASIKRLLRNQDDIGNAIKPFYGRAAGNRLTQLLRTHIQEAVPVLVAAKNGDQAGLDAAVKAWYRNARQIGTFLGTANPHWGVQEMRAMMRTHITETIAYASDLLQGRYGQAVADYNRAERHMRSMATMLSDGLIAQFPSRFGG